MSTEWVIRSRVLFNATAATLCVTLAVEKKSPSFSFCQVGTYDTASFENFLRMPTGTFDELLEHVGPRISKQRTVYREPTDPGLKLALPLRHLQAHNSWTCLEGATEHYLSCCEISLSGHCRSARPPPMGGTTFLVTSTVSGTFPIVLVLWSANMLP